MCKLITSIHVKEDINLHLLSSALHDFQWDGIDLVIYADRFANSTTDLHHQHSEVCSTQIQGQEFSGLWSRTTSNGINQYTNCSF